MAKNIMIRKHEDKVEIRDTDGGLICDIVVADSSRTNSVNLSIQADRVYAIDKVRQKNHDLLRTNENQHSTEAAG